MLIPKYECRGEHRYQCPIPRYVCRIRKREVKTKSRGAKERTTLFSLANPQNEFLEVA